MTEGNASDDQIRAFVLGTNDAAFLLDDDLAEYLKAIRNQAIELRTFNKMLEGLPVGEKRTKVVDGSSKRFLWMAQQSEVLVAKFRPFLTLDRRKRSS